MSVMAVDCKEETDGNGVEVKSFDENTGFKVSSWGYRHQQSLIMFFMLTVAYSMRSCMGVSLVAMTYHEYSNVINNNTNLTANNIDSNKVSSINVTVEEEEFKMNGFFNALMLTPPYPQFKWSKQIQDTVISSFFWGYMSMQLPAGHLVHKFGSQYLLTGAMLVNCVVSIVLPLATYYGGWVCTVLCRMAQGFTQACIMPGMHSFFGKWAPLEERGRLSTIAYGGQAIGAVLGLPITGFISSSPLGWPGVFRFYGILSGIIGVVLWVFCADTPAKHPKISHAERKYIQEALGQTEGKKPMRVPWGKILRYKGMYAIIIAHIGQSWGQVFLYSEVPAYMDYIMGVNIKANGLLTALPFFVMWITNFFYSWFTDMLIVRKVLNVTNTRKFANSLGTIPAAIGFVCLALAPRNIYIVETILVIICGFKVAAHAGFQSNHIDTSPNFAGTMMSVSNFAANAFACLTPLVAGFILTDAHDANLWHRLFYITAGFYFFTNLVYVLLGTAERADWDDPDDEEQGKEDIEGKPMIEKEVQTNRS